MIPVLEIGGTHVTAALVDPLEGRITGRTRTPLDADGDAEAILDTVRRCADGLPVPPGARWGVAVPGPFDYAKGVALFEDVGKFDALYGMDMRAALLRGLRHRPGDVVFVNDAHAFLTGEWSAGTVRGHRRAVGITLGTGVGSAFLADGRIRDHGPGLPPEGRMDLTEIAGRPLEETISRRAILTRYGDPAADVHDIAVRARAGEERARRVLVDVFTALGVELGPRMADFGATVLVVGAPWPAPGTSSPPHCSAVSQPGLATGRPTCPRAESRRLRGRRGTGGRGPRDGDADPRRGPGRSPGMTHVARPRWAHRVLAGA